MQSFFRNKKYPIILFIMLVGLLAVFCVQNKENIFAVDYEIKMNNNEIDTNYRKEDVVKSSPSVITYGYTGNYQTFIASENGEYKIQLWGAAGGSQSTNSGGKGSYTTGNIYLKKDDILYFYVGGKGKVQPDSTIGIASGGWNGGAQGETTRTNCSQKISSGGGGTDVRLVPGAWNNIESLTSRIMVAGGGGGYEAHYCSSSVDAVTYTGGNGGELIGEASTINFNVMNSSLTPLGGTQTRGGWGLFTWRSGTHVDYYTGSFGVGGTFDYRLETESGSYSTRSYGGGGGGYYGGATGGWKSGAGGSSYISGYLGSIAVQSSGDITPKNGCYDNSNDIKCSYHYSGYVFTNTNMIAGSKEMPDYKSSTGATMIGNDSDGYATIELIRTLESDSSLKSLSSSFGNLAPTFNETTYSYTLNVPYNVGTISFEGIANSTSSNVTSLEDVELEEGETKTIVITVTAEDGSVTNYTIDVVRNTYMNESSTLLKSLNLNKATITPKFNPNIFSYDIEISGNDDYVAISGVPYDSTATVKVTGASMIVNNTGVVTIRVSKPGLVDSIYTFNYLRKTNYEAGFDYTGEYKEFVAPYSGKYKVELWGASGGTFYESGRGAYTSGETTLNKGETIYVYVGGSGANSIQERVGTYAGGWNGGATTYTSRSNSTQLNSGGGGATDIRLKPTSSKTTWNELESLTSRIMVAGGGGGIMMFHYSNSNWAIYDGGAGGDLVGKSAKIYNYSGASTITPIGGSQTNGGKGLDDWTSTSYSNNYIGSFGIGGTATGSGSSFAGGGGGYYGGATGNWKPGAGGSSYISGYAGSVAVASQSSTAPKSGCVDGTTDIECSYHYSGKIFENATMIAGDSPMPDYHQNTNDVVGNFGNGYAKITLLNAEIDNTFLTSLEVNNGTLIPNFDPEISEYSLSVPYTTASIYFNAVAMNPNATVVGAGGYELALGKTQKIEIIVTGEYGGVRTYTVNVTRDAYNNEHTSKLSSMSVTNFEFDELFDSNKLNYDLHLLPNMTTISINTSCYDFEASVVTSGTFNLVGTTGTITVTVTEPHTAPTIYTITYIKDKIIEDVYGYTGDYQEFVAKQEAYYTIEAWGAAGGSSGIYYGGNGAYTKGTLYMKSGDKLYAYIGGKGMVGTRATIGYTSGGFNGGGNTYISRTNCDQWNSSGGGATDFRTEIGNLNSRIMVAGGGGGFFHNNCSSGDQSDAIGGAGGKLSGEVAIYTHRIGFSSLVPLGGTQTNGGKGLDDWTSTSYSNNYIGLFGQGGTASTSGGSYAGGGGGYYGGATGKWKPAAGGSSYISGYIGAVAVQSASDTGTKFACSEGTTDVSCSYHYSNYIFEDALMISGKEEMPDYKTPGSTMVGNDSDGHAKVTLLKLLSSNNYLATLTSDIGTFDKTFDPEIYNYTLTLSKTDSIINIDATTYDDEASISGTGRYQIKIGTQPIEIIVTAENGDTKTYTINVVRPGLNPGEHSSLLSYLEIKDYEGNLIPDFNPMILDYDIQILANEMELNVDFEVFDLEANVSIIGNQLMLDNKGIIKITVNEPNVPTTVYTINYKKTSSTSSISFGYLNDYQVFTAPRDDAYKFELWGAGGGYTPTYAAGKGAYTSGILNLKKGEKLYIYTGGQGNVGTRSKIATIPGGYNGGGDAYITRTGCSTYLSSSGGASDVRTEIDNLNSRIMVAAGGAGFADWYCGTTDYSTLIGGNGGALVGEESIYKVRVGGSSIKPTGATQTTGGLGLFDWNATGGYKVNYGSGSFGKGSSNINGNSADARYDSVNYDYTGFYSSTGGGGGWYGGAVGGWQGGSGGSSYISGYQGSVAVKSSSDSSPRLDADGNDCADGTTDDLCSISYTNYVFTDGVMIPGSQVMPNYDGSTKNRVGNSENGYVRVTAQLYSKNNYLSALVVIVNDIEKTIYFDPVKLDYYLNVTVDELNLELSARPYDSTSSIDGLGEYIIPAGTTDYPIVVTAKNGDVRTYTVHITRPASTESKVESIKINGLIPSLCNVNNAYCNLSPSEFNKNVNAYTLTIPYRIRQLYFDVEKAHYFQKIIGDGQISINGGDNIITIDVESEDGLNHSVYTYNVTRDMSGDNDLKYFDIIDPNRNINYDPDITEYYITVPNDYENYIFNSTNDLDSSLSNYLQMYVEKDSDNATLIVDSTTGTLNVGNNEINVVVIAQNGDVRTYTLNVYREKSSNALLDDLTIANETDTFALTPIFNPAFFGTYTVTIPNEVDSVNINAIPASLAANIAETGLKILKTGNNYYNIVVTSEDGQAIETYKINIYREKNSDATLSNIEVNTDTVAWTLNPVFDTDTTYYEVIVGEGITSIDIIPTLNAVTSSVSLPDGKIIKVGNNMKRVIITAEDGTIKTYTIKVTRPANEDYKLDGMNISNKTNELVYMPNFNSDVSSYSLTVENDIDNVDIDVTKFNELEIVKGIGNYNLKVGLNTINISVTSESGISTLYTIEITRKPNSNAYLKGINLSSGNLDPSFDKDIYSYTVDIGADIFNLNICGVAEVSTTTASCLNLNNIIAGEQSVNIVTLAEDGITTLTYVVNIRKSKSSNNDLSSLYLEESKINSTFDSGTTSYTAKVPYAVTNVTAHYTVDDARASAIITGGTSLVVGDNIITIDVTAEDGSLKTYTIIVTRQILKDNDALSTLTVSEGMLNPMFNKDVLYYEVEVDNEINSIVVGGTSEDPDAIIKGLGTKNLLVGVNTIQVEVETTDGYTRTYTIDITRKKSSEARIETLSINGDVLNELFDKDVYSYTMTSENGSIDFTNIKLMNQNATYLIVGNSYTSVGDHDVDIIVTAEDGTIKTYTIKVTRVENTNNYLNSLEVVGYSLSPTFDKTLNNYEVIVPNNINSIEIKAMAESTFSTISGQGIKSIYVGDNNFTLIVTSESGVQNIYNLKIIRDGSSNANLKTLSVTGQTLSPTFDKDITKYIINVPFSIKILDMLIETEDSNATYEVNGNKGFEVGSNTIEIVVTSENGTKKTYSITVNREDPVSALIDVLKVKGYNLNENFVSNTFNYTLTVNNETTKLDFLIAMQDSGATYEIAGNENFIEGNNTVTITTHSRDYSLTETYTINVYRQQSTNNFLSLLSTNRGEVSPTFVKNVMEYSLDVNKSVNDVTIYAAAEDASAVVTGTGTFSVLDGENKFNIMVTKSGVVRVYILTVNKSDKNTNSKLSELKVKDYNITPTFTQSTYDYYITVPNTKTSLTKDEITVTAADSKAVVDRPNGITLVTGENIYEITVTAEDGITTNTYKLHITREASSEARLSNVTISNIKDAITFDKDTYEYDVTTLDTSLSFTNIVKMDENSTYEVIDNSLVDGLNVVKIVVTAQDNVTTKEYVFNVTKLDSSNNYLSNLEVESYLLTPTFDKNTLEYIVTVPFETTNVNILATLEDSNAKSLIGIGNKSLNVGTNEFVVSATSYDGEVRSYKVIITRSSGTHATLESLSVNIGTISPSFNKDIETYTWVVPKGTLSFGKDNITYKTTDSDSVVVIPSSVDVSSGNGNVTVTVTSGDTLTEKIYTLNVEYEKDTNSNLLSLSVDKGEMTPTFDKDTLAYDVYLYEDEPELTITAQAESTYIQSLIGDGTITLTDTDTTQLVVVQAEDGSIKTYTLNIHRTKKHETGLANLTLDKLDEVSEYCIDDKCTLSPVFSDTEFSYAIKVPYEYEELYIKPTPKNDEQTIKYYIDGEEIENGDYKLPVDKNVKVTVKVYDYFGVETDTYTLNVTRAKSNNTNLKSLKVSSGADETYEEYEITPEYADNVLSYKVVVPYEITEVNVEYEIANEDASATLSGYNYLLVGNNDVMLTVIAFDGTVKVYTIEVVRLPKYTSALKNITVSTGDFYSLTPKFDPVVEEYTVVVPGTASKVTIEGIPFYEEKTFVSGNGEYSLVTGKNTVVIKGISKENPEEVKEYTINVIKEVSREVDLESLSVLEGVLSPEFDSTTTKYEIEVVEDVTSLTINAIPKDRNATIIITGNKNFITGSNRVNVIVMSEDKSASKTYQITVNKKASSDTSLSGLNVYDKDDNDLTLTYDEALNEYNVEVAYDVEEVRVETCANDTLASVQGNGIYYLAFGNNEINVLVTAEDGSVGTYKINVCRNYNLNLSDIEISKGTLTPAFDKDTLEYRVNLSNIDKTITVNGIRESSLVSVSGNMTYNLLTGENEISLVVTAPDSKTKTYKMVVEREKSANNYLKKLEVKDGVILPVFEKTNEEYEINVRNTVTNLDIEAKVEDKTASYEIIGNSFSGEGMHDVIIRVTAENAEVRDYIIHVNVRPDSYFSNRLKILSTDEGIFNPDFDPDINYYAMTLEKSITGIKVEAEAESDTATVEIYNADGDITSNGYVGLKIGRNEIRVKVISEDGIENYYTIIVYRKSDADASLSNLIVTGYSINPIFNKAEYEYRVTVPGEVNDLEVIATSTDPNAVVTITGNTNLDPGENTITVHVDSYDGTVSKEYKIIVTKEASKNNYLKDLSISGYTINPVFDKTNNGPYTLTVSNTVNNVIINAETESIKSTVSGIGSKVLAVGTNLLKVLVTAESGDVRTYTLVVTKEADTDSSLMTLVTSDGELKPTFDSSITDYEVEVDDVLDRISVIGLASSSKATVKGNGTYNLTEAETIIKIKVTAEDKSETEYKITVKKNVKPSSKIKSMINKEGELSPSFDKNTLDYTIMVPNEITELDLSSIILEDSAASYVVTGNSSFIVGSNIVNIVVTSSDSSSVTTYKINVLRQSPGSNYLKSLGVIGYTLTPVFDKTVLYYEVTVPAEITQVQIKASKEDSSSTLSGTGYKTLTGDISTYYIRVTSSSGSVRTYQVVVKKDLSEDNDLLTLTSDKGTFNKTFDKNTLEYILTVDAGETEVTFSGTYPTTATVTGLEKVLITGAGDTEHNIVVTSESGSVKTYKVTIRRGASSNTDVDNIIPSSGTLVPAFDNSINLYEIEVDDSTSVISFVVTTKDSNATVSGNDITLLAYGENNIKIKITAEDLTEREIDIKVTRNKNLGSISAKEKDIVIKVNEEKTIEYTLIPSDTTYPNVEFTTSDNTTVTVDADGKIKGIKEGTAIITITSKKDSSIKETINVNVMNTKITSSIYTIGKTIDNENYVIGCDPNTALSSFLDNFDNSPSLLNVYDKDGNKITDLTSYTGSYMKIKLEYKGTVYDELTILIRGDLNGDGIVTVSDKTTVKNMILGKTSKTETDTLISDINGDGNITVSDSTSLKNFILGKVSTLN